MTRKDLTLRLKIAGIRCFFFAVLCLAVPFLLVWSSLVIRFTFPASVQSILSWLFPLSCISILLFMKDLARALQIFAVLCGLIFFYYFCISPSNNRNWAEDVEKIPEVSFNERSVTIKNFRHFTFVNSHDFEKKFEHKTYNLDNLEGTDFIISYWDGHLSIGHTFVSFRFKDQPPLCISVEVRKEKGESYHPVNGIFKQYELIYVIGDERDMISLRTNHRGEETFLYPLTLTKEQSEQFLVSLLKGAEKLVTSPQFYHSLDRNCTTTLVSHINDVQNFKININADLILNGLSDYAVYKLEGVTNELPFITLKRCCYISKLAKETPLDVNYSKKLRESVQQKIKTELNHSH